MQKEKPIEKLGVIALLMLAVSLVCLVLSIFEYAHRISGQGWDNTYLGVLVIFIFTTTYLVYGLLHGE
jgi:hypothetical protein